MTDIATIDPAAPRWRWSHEGGIRPGSEAHKQLFCRMLLDTFDPYKPAIVAWPSLAPAALGRLVSLPFWNIAVETELHTSKNMQAIADTVDDALIREALALNAFEERRHKEVIENMVRYYGIAITPDQSFTAPPDPEWAYLCTGYGECFDSFFSFGLFRLAKQNAFLPRELMEAFEPIIQEEARHILFFVNWAVYAQARRGGLARPLFVARRFAALATRAWRRAKLAKGRAGQGSELGRNNSAMTIEGRNFMGDLSLARFLQLCRDENDRRMARYDRRLLRPRAMPRLVGLAMPLLRLIG